MNSKFKPFKAQFYKSTPEKTESGIKYHKEYPYSSATYLNGGLWCAAQQQVAKEEPANAAVKAVKTIKLRMNYNSSITIDSTMKAIFKNEIYDVGIPDAYEFENREISVLLTLSSDNNEYTEEAVFNE